MKKLLIGIGLVGLIFTFNSCSDSGEEEETDPCLNGPKITIDQITNSIEGQDDGVILSSATGGKSPYTFSIDDTNFQTSSSFANLGGGNYNVTVKDANGCTSSTSAEVKEIPFVSFADEVNPIIQASCQVTGCHGDNTSIPDFSTYTNIEAKADRIKVRTSDGTMPLGGSLTDTEVQKISDWVDQGAPNN